MADKDTEFEEEKGYDELPVSGFNVVQWTEEGQVFEAQFVSHRQIEVAGFGLRDIFDFVPLEGDEGDEDQLISVWGTTLLTPTLLEHAKPGDIIKITFLGKRGRTSRFRVQRKQKGE